MWVLAGLGLFREDSEGVLESLDVLLLCNSTRALSCTRNAQKVAVLDLSCVVLIFFVWLKMSEKKKANMILFIPLLFLR